MGMRPPLSGYNHNIRYKNRVYHVQTEDSGLATPHVFTHLFLEGQIISSARTEYKDLVDDPDNEKKVRKMMQDQHKRLMKQLRRGELDDKIISLVGALEPEVPAVAEGEIPEAVELPATAEAEVPAAAEAEVPATAEAELPAARPVPPAPAPATPERPDLPPVPLPPVSVADSLLLSKFPLPDDFPESGPPTGEICPLPPLDQPEPDEPEPAPARPRQPLRARPDVEVTEAIDIRALHGLPPEEEAKPARVGTQPKVSVVEEFPGDAFLDGQRPEPTTTYSHVYRDKVSPEVPAVSGRRRIETPLPMRTKGTMPQRTQPPPPPVPRPPARPPVQDQQRRTSRVFGQPLPQSTRFGTPSEEATPVPVPVPIRPRRSGVYLVPGGPPQRPPHPDPAVRRPEARTASSPQRYTAPRASSTGTPQVRKRRQTGAYEIPGPDGARPPSSPAIRPVEARPVPLVKPKGPQRPPPPVARPARPPSPPAVPARPARPPSRPAVPVRPQPPAQRPAAPAGPPASRPAPPARPQQVVARPVVVVGQPVNVGRPRPRTDRQVPPPQATKPPPAPPRQPGEPPPRARVPSTVFGSDLISERSLDEVILAYLAEDSEGEE